MTSDSFDAYETLEVRRDASEAVIRAAHRELSKRHHPDRGTGAAGAEAMVQINEARAILLNRARRAEHDEDLARRDAAAQSKEDPPPDQSTAPADESSQSADFEDWEDEWGYEDPWEPPRERTSYPAPAPDPVGRPRHGEQRFPQDPMPQYPTYVRRPPSPYPYTPAAPLKPAVDAVSVTAFVVALLCIAAPVAAILGTAGLYRTRRGIRRGRWAAVCATVLGTVMSIPLLVGYLISLVPDDPTPSSVAVGDCVDVEGDWTASAMRASDCASAHDAEVLHQGQFDAGHLKAFNRTTRPARFCRNLLSQHVRRAVARDDLRMRLIVESDSPRSPEDGEPFACLAASPDGSDLTRPVVD